MGPHHQFVRKHSANVIVEEHAVSQGTYASKLHHLNFSDKKKFR